MIFDSNIILESYHGQTTNIKKAQLAVDKIHKKILDGMKTGKLEFEKENKELEKSLCKEFNTRKIHITWITDGDLNAYTMKTRNYSTERWRIKNKDKNIPFITSISSAPNKLSPIGDIFIFINTGLISVLEFTPREIMGVILHEMGHQINMTPYKAAEETYFTISTLGANLVITPLIGNAYATMTSLMHNTLQKYFPQVANVYHQVGSFLNNYTVSKTSIIQVAKNIPKMIMKGPMAFLNYGEERMADAIVSDYGYAPELITSHQKFETMYGKDINKVINSIPVVNAVYSANRLLIHLLCTIVDEHPNSQTRVTQSIKRLERDLQDPNLPPQLKKELTKDLNRAKKVYENDYLSKNAKDYNHAVYLKRQFCDKLFGGNDDWREIFAPLYNSIEDK